MRKNLIHRLLAAARRKAASGSGTPEQIARWAMKLGEKWLKVRLGQILRGR